MYTDESSSYNKKDTFDSASQMHSLIWLSSDSSFYTISQMIFYCLNNKVITTKNNSKIMMN